MFPFINGSMRIYLFNFTYLVSTILISTTLQSLYFPRTSKVVIWYCKELFESPYHVTKKKNIFVYLKNIIKIMPYILLKSKLQTYFFLFENSVVCYCSCIKKKSQLFCTYYVPTYLEQVTLMYVSSNLLELKKKKKTN